ncbi:MAG: hypothetical protein KatS3mg008_0020 [Acidimicrobiales bacterium]|nr:MAG: hypothetical protein KatS3mg008_0020 [Acidimicrobiales bacterium]
MGIAADPPIALAMPTYQSERYVSEAIASVLAQTRADFRLWVVDDGSTDTTVEQVRRTVGSDRRVRVVRLGTRHGMIAAWRVSAVRALAGRPRWFAWVADHDLLEPQWLEALASCMTDRPDAVLAWPLTDRIDSDSRPIGETAEEWTTDGLAPRERASAAIWSIRGAGDMVYGLFDARSLVEAGIFRRFLLPDLLLVAEVALMGHVVQVPEVLRHRRVFPTPSLPRQRETLFSEALPKPWWTRRLPARFTHRCFLAARLAFAPPPTLTVPRSDAAEVAAAAAALTAARWLRDLPSVVARRIDHGLRSASRGASRGVTRWFAPAVGESRPL